MHSKRKLGRAAVGRIELLIVAASESMQYQAFGSVVEVNGNRKCISGMLGRGRRAWDPHDGSDCMPGFSEICGSLWKRQEIRHLSAVLHHVRSKRPGFSGRSYL